MKWGTFSTTTKSLPHLWLAVGLFDDGKHGRGRNDVLWSSMTDFRSYCNTKIPDDRTLLSAGPYTLTVASSEVFGSGALAVDEKVWDFI
jgi:hypothetical protein